MRHRCVFSHRRLASYIAFFINAPATTDIYTLSLHDALPIFKLLIASDHTLNQSGLFRWVRHPNYFLNILPELVGLKRDRKSTRLNSSHVAISYAVFCLKKKKKKS